MWGKVDVDIEWCWVGDRVGGLSGKGRNVRGGIEGERLGMDEVWGIGGKGVGGK